MKKITNFIKLNLIKTEIALTFLIIFIIFSVTISLLSIRFGDEEYYFGLYLIFPNLLFISFPLIGLIINIAFYGILILFATLGFIFYRKNKLDIFIHIILILLTIAHFISLIFTYTGLLAIAGV